MSVHEKHDEVKALLGIPQDEPIFILRGQDRAAMETVDDYLLNVQDEGASVEFEAGVEKALANFTHFRATHPARMKTPD
ncbi:MAG: hypothetical protein ABIQ41_09055 [Gemmatimonadales bacterium]